MRPGGGGGALLPVNLQVHDYSGAQRYTYINRASRGILLLYIIDTAKASAEQRLEGCKHC
jgi:hypothetical protein